MIRQVVGALGAAVIALAPIAASAECFTESEWRAAHVRVLQTELQVAALECANVAGASYNDQYSQFITRFQDRLKANATALKAHFARVYGKNRDHELDIFVTKVANDASDRSMQDLKFCANSAASFQTALALDTVGFEQAAVAHVTDHSEVGDECPAKAAVIQTASAKKTTTSAAVTQTAAKPAAKKAKATTTTTAAASAG